MGEREEKKGIKKFLDQVKKFAGLFLLCASFFIGGAITNSFGFLGIGEGGGTAVVVTNFGELVTLIQKLKENFEKHELWPYVINQLMKKMFVDVLSFFKVRPGVLDFNIEKLLSYLDDEYYRAYEDYVRQLNSFAKEGPSAWYCLIPGFCEKPTVNGVDATAAPVFQWDDESARSKILANAQYIQGDFSYLQKLYNENVAGNKNIPDTEKERLFAQMRRLEGAKKGLAIEVVDIGATFEKINKLREQIDEQLFKLSNVIDSRAYTSDQAIKDLLKLETLRMRLELELARLQANHYLVQANLDNLRLSKEESVLLSDLIRKSLKVEEEK